jgi:predicted amidohydrolase YtcJ
MKKQLAPFLVLSVCGAVQAGTPPPGKVADTIWYNGPIVTVDADHPDAQAVAVKGGKILAVGSRKDVMRSKGAATRMIDLHGATLIPGFVDAHGHVSMVGFQALSANLLPPPDGANDSIAKLQETLAAFRKQSPNPDKFGILFGFGYDDSQLKEQRHPTRQDLDAVATDIPIVIVHQSSHLGVFNSKALEIAGITADTLDPEGGSIQREGNSKQPNGVLEENAFFAALMKIFPKLTPDQSVAMLLAGQKLYVSYGYTTIQDGRATPGQVQIAMKAAAEGKLVADTVSYPDILTPGAAELMTAPWYHDVTHVVSYSKHFRIGGVKLTLDGSPQAKTAWLSKPYFKPPAGKDASYVGYGVLKDDEAIRTYEEAISHHWQILTHANGDRAIDQMLMALGTAEKANPGIDVRPVLIHGQTLRHDQVPQLKELKIFPSLFPMHTYYWGDWHRESVLGPERAENISPTQWVLQEGMMFSTHHDAPVALPDSMRVLASTVNRTTRTGYVLGPDQRVDPLTALKAMTIWPAYQYFEEKTKGSITVGKLADFVVLSGNPLTVDRSTIADLKVLETIKEGTSIYRRPDDKVAMMPPDFGMHSSDPSRPIPAGIPQVAEGDGDLGPAFDVIFSRLEPDNNP